jgi:hypothetical protein
MHSRTRKTVLQNTLKKVNPTETGCWQGNKCTTEATDRRQSDAFQWMLKLLTTPPLRLREHGT